MQHTLYILYIAQCECTYTQLYIFYTHTPHLDRWSVFVLVCLILFSAYVCSAVHLVYVEGPGRLNCHNMEA